MHLIIYSVNTFKLLSELIQVVYKNIFKLE
jgi:hypothetical protein